MPVTLNPRTARFPLAKTGEQPLQHVGLAMNVAYDLIATITHSWFTNLVAHRLADPVGAQLRRPQQ